jgi:hypothetical protein
MNLGQPLRRIVVVFLLFALAACATPVTPAAPATPSPTAPLSATTAAGAPGTPTGKLTPRLQQLADTPSLRTASADEQARALSLPAKGPGSLVHDKQGRILVTMRTGDVSDTFQKTLLGLGADIQDVSDRYQSITLFVPLDQLTAIAKLPAVQNVQEELAATPGGGWLAPVSSV